MPRPRRCGGHAERVQLDAKTLTPSDAAARSLYVPRSARPVLDRRRFATTSGRAQRDQKHRPPVRMVDRVHVDPKSLTRPILVPPSAFTDPFGFREHWEIVETEAEGDHIRFTPLVRSGKAKSNRGT